MHAFKFLTSNWVRIVVISFSNGFAWAQFPSWTERSSLGDCASSGGPWIKNGSPLVDCCWTSFCVLSWICQAQLCDLSCWRHKCCTALIEDHHMAHVRYISLHTLVTQVWSNCVSATRILNPHSVWPNSAKACVFIVTNWSISETDVSLERFRFHFLYQYRSLFPIFKQLDWLNRSVRHI